MTRRAGARGERPVVRLKPQAGDVGTAGDGDVAAGEEVGHGRQRVHARRSGKPQWLADVLGVHDDLTEAGRSAS